MLFWRQMLEKFTTVSEELLCLLKFLLPEFDMSKKVIVMIISPIRICPKNVYEIQGWKINLQNSVILFCKLNYHFQTKTMTD